MILYSWPTAITMHLQKQRAEIVEINSYILKIFSR